MADEPLFMAIDSDNPLYQAAIEQARASMAQFLAHIAVARFTGLIPCIKARITAGDEEAFLWLMNARPDGPDFVAEVFEIPPAFAGIAAGDEIRVPRDEILDWMVNEDGVLHGGFSLRYQRSLLPEDRRAWFDEHIGVTRFS